MKELITPRNSDSIFSKECYAVAERLLKTIEDLVSAIWANQQPNWSDALAEVLLKKLAIAMNVGGFDTPTKSQFGGYLLLQRWLARQSVDIDDWVSLVAEVRKVFPAFDARLNLTQSPELGPEGAEALAYLKFDADLLDSMWEWN